MITAYYAQFYYRLALALVNVDLSVVPENRDFVGGMIGDLSENEVTLRVNSPLHQEFMAACVKKAESIMARLRSVAPADGQLYEQFDKSSGKPVSSRGIGVGALLLFGRSSGAETGAGSLAWRFCAA